MRVTVFDPGSFTPHYDADLCQSLAGLGLSVELVASPPLFESAEPSDSFQTLNLFFRFTGGAAQPFLRRHARIRQALKSLSYPFSLWRAWRLLKGRQPGLLHVQWALLPVLDVLLFRGLRARGWRVVYTAHDGTFDLARPWRRRGLRRVLSQTDAVIAHTSELAELLRRESGGGTPEIWKIPLGACTFPLLPGLERERARRVLGLAPGGPLLLFFGMIKPYKGLDYLLRAWPRVLREFPEARLLIAGEAIVPFAPFESLIEALNIGDSVIRRLGYVPRTQAQYYFCASDAVVLPYVEITASGLVPVAYRYSRPVIATSIGGLTEAVTDNETGILAAPRSEQALAEAICRGLRDPSMLARMGAAAYHRSERDFNWNEAAQRTLELYRHVDSRA